MAELRAKAREITWGTTCAFCSGRPREWAIIGARHVGWPYHHTGSGRRRRTGSGGLQETRA
jgi:hypothetical protein